MQSQEQQQRQEQQFDIQHISLDGEISNYSGKRQPWQTPEITHLQVKRTMVGSGASGDGPGSSL